MTAALLTCVLAFPVSGARGAENELLGAASREHFWLLQESEKPDSSFQLVHCPADEGAWHYRPQYSMAQAPVAMTAWGDTLWLVFAARPNGEQWQREVCATQITRNPATGLYICTPAGRLETLPPLPGSGRLAGIIGTRSGPVALVLASSRSGVALASGSAMTQPSLDEPVLLRLTRGGQDWEPIALPPEFAGAGNATVAIAGPDGDRLVVLEDVADNPMRTVRHDRHADGAWATSSLPLEFRQIRSIVSVAGQMVAVLVDRRQDGDEVSFAYLRPGQEHGTVIPLTSTPLPPGKWRADAFDNSLVLVQRERGNDRRLTVRRIDPLTGNITAATEFRRQPLTVGSIGALSLVLGLSLITVLLFMLVRPARTSPITVDPARVLPLGRRIVAVVIDLVIAAVPVMLLLDCSPRDLVAVPMLTLDFTARGSGPYVATVLTSVVVSTILEMVLGRSLGGVLVGARVMTLDGRPAGPLRALARAAPKALVLLAPPLAVLAVLNRHMQGLPDVVARTLVLSADQPAPESPAEP